MPMESRSSVLKMKEDKTLEFIDLYHKEECLWNTKSKDFTSREKRYKAAVRVAKALNMPNFKSRHVIIKFKNIRNSYCQELRKIAASENLGGDYKPKVFWFSKIDAFLKPHLSKKFGQTDAGYLGYPVVNDDSVKHAEWEISIDNNSTLESLSDDGHSTASVSDNLLEPLPKRPKPADPLEAEEISRDYYDDFGKYVASLLRTLPPKKALALQPKIVNFITESALTDND